MNYSLTPFPNQPSLEASLNPGGPVPDIRDTLAKRPGPHHERALANSIFLDVIVDSLQDVSSPFYITHCHESNGDLHLSAASAANGYDVTEGDEIRGGLYIRNSESCRFETLICTRLYRVVCANGLFMECEKEQAFTIPEKVLPPANWQSKVRQIVSQSFDDQHLITDFQRFGSTLNQVLATPYEFLCHLEAQQLITDDEQSAIQTAFNDNAEYSMYGLINAVTQSAHERRASDQWLRAFELERLAGEILRGDHNLPAFDFAYA